MDIEERLGIGIDPENRYPSEKPSLAVKNLLKDLDGKEAPKEYLELYLCWLSKRNGSSSSVLISLIRALRMFIEKEKDKIDIPNKINKKFEVSDLKRKNWFFKKSSSNEWIIFFKEYPNNLPLFKIVFEKKRITNQLTMERIERIQNPLFSKSVFSGLKEFEEFNYRNTSYYLHPDFKDKDNLQVITDWRAVEDDKEGIVTLVREYSNTTGWEECKVYKKDKNSIMIKGANQKAKLTRNISNLQNDGYITLQVNNTHMADLLLIDEKYVVDINLATLDLASKPEEIKERILNYPIHSLLSETQELFSQPSNRLGDISRFLKSMDILRKEVIDEVNSGRTMKKVLEGNKDSSKLQRWYLLDKELKESLKIKDLFFTVLFPIHLIWALLFFTLSQFEVLSYKGIYLQTHLFLLCLISFLFVWFPISVLSELFSYSEDHYFISKISHLSSIVEAHLLFVLLPFWLFFQFLYLFKPSLSPSLQSQLLIPLIIFGLIPLALKFRKKVVPHLLFRGIFFSILAIPYLLTRYPAWIIITICIFLLLVMSKLKDSKFVLILRKFKRTLSVDKERTIGGITDRLDEEKRTITLSKTRGLICSYLKDAGFTQKGESDKFEFSNQKYEKKIVLTLKENEGLNKKQKIDLEITEDEDEEIQSQESLFLETIEGKTQDNSHTESKHPNITLPNSSEPKEWIEIFEKTGSDDEMEYLRSKIDDGLSDRKLKMILYALIDSSEVRETFQGFVNQFNETRRGYICLGKKEGKKILKQKNSYLGGLHILSRVLEGNKVLIYTEGYFKTTLGKYREIKREEDPQISCDKIEEENVEKCYLREAIKE